MTILGIVIGVGAVITMVTIGGGATAQVKEQIASMGSNLLMVTPGKRLGPGQSSNTVLFKVSDGEAILRDVSSIAAVAPVSSKSIQAVFGNENWSTTVTGSDNQYFRVTNRSIAKGRQFSDSELRAGAAVCIVGETVRKKLFGGQESLMGNIRLEKLSCQVIGILNAKGQNTMGMDQDDIVVIPLRTYQRRISGNQDVAMFQVSVQQGASTDKAQQDIRLLMRERRHLSPSDDDNFNVMDMKEIANMLTGTTQLLTALLSAVAAVSLLVGGIGIMNIMLVSVTERTREIGLRMAVGARRRDILSQFLIEAVTLCVVGGLIGLLIGGGAALAMSIWGNWPIALSPALVLIALLSAGLVGVFFGYYPARRAAQMNPIDALRYE
jgi:putative ABC transport system permease protein